MANEIHPDEAAGALREIARRREQVVNLAIAPTWFWWAFPLLLVGFSVTVETWRRPVVGIIFAVFLLGNAIIVGCVLLGTVRRAKPRNNLLGRAGILAIPGFMLGALAVCSAVSVALKAAGVGYAQTWSTLLFGVVMVVGGPLLTRRLRRGMLKNPIGGRR